MRITIAKINILTDDLTHGFEDKYNLEDKLMEIIKKKKEKRRLKGNEQHFRDLGNNFMHLNIYVMSVSEKEKREKA